MAPPLYRELLSPFCLLCFLICHKFHSISLQQQSVTKFVGTLTGHRRSFKQRTAALSKKETLTCNFIMNFLSMPSQKFRKLDIDLPRQRSFDQRPWLAAGLLLAFIILLMSAYAYFRSMKSGTSPRTIQTQL